MVDKDKQIILAEIERRLKEYKDLAPDYYTYQTDSNVRELKELVGFINSIPEEPVSKDLEDIASQLAQKYFPDEYNIWARPNIEAHDCKNACIEMAKWQKEHLWKPADGNDLPEIDREVVAFQEIFPTDVDVSSLLKIVIAHRPNKYTKVWNSDLGEEQVVEIERHGKGGWNIPDIVYWLDVELPKEIEP